MYHVLIHKIMTFDKSALPAPEEKERYLLMNHLICIHLQHLVQCTYIAMAENQVIHNCTVA